MIVAVVGALLLGALIPQAFQAGTFNLFSRRKKKRKRSRSRSRRRRKRPRNVDVGSDANKIAATASSNRSVFSNNGEKLSNLFEEVEGGISDVTSFSKESNPPPSFETDSVKIAEALNNIPQHSHASDSIWRSPSLLPHHPAFILVPDEVKSPIYVVPRPLFGPQTYIAKELSSVHGIQHLDCLKEELQKYNNRPVHFMSLSSNHATDEIAVWNSSVDGLQVPNHQEIENYLMDNHTNLDNQVERQEGSGVKMNFGFYSAVNNPNRDEDGVARPHLHPRTLEEIPRNLFCAASQFVSESNPFTTGPMSPERASFSKQIDPACCLEASTIARATTTAFHRDKMNPKEKENSFVLVQNYPSFERDNEWVSLIFYQRKSVSDYLMRKTSATPYVKFIRDALSKFPAYRQSTEKLFDYLQAEYSQTAPNLPLSISPCLDPLGHYNIALVCVITLVQEMQLNFLETIGLVNALVLFSKTFEPCLLATLKWLRHKPRNVFHCGVGYEFLLEMNAFYEKGMSCKTRFNNYRQLEYPSYKEFQGQVYDLLHFCLRSSGKHRSRPSKKTICATYDGIHSAFTSKYEGIGRMIGIHSLAFLSYLGLVPSWIRTHGHYDLKARVYVAFQKRFNLGTRKDDPDKFMCVVSKALGISVSRVENVLCKIFQERWSEDSIPRKSKHADIHFWKAPFIVARGDELVLMMKKNIGSGLPLTDSVLISSWLVDGDSMSIADIGTNYMEKEARGFPKFASADMDVSPLLYEIPVWW